MRKVHNNTYVEVDTHRYSVPWWLIGAEVWVEVQYGKVRILAGEHEVAGHDQLPGRGGGSMDPAHLAGIVSRASLAEEAPLLLRPMSEYQDHGRSALVTDSRHEYLTALLTRLKLTAVRERLDNLIDEAARRELT
jgi:hypothetical protein